MERKFINLQHSRLLCIKLLHQITATLQLKQLSGVIYPEINPSRTTHNHSSRTTMSESYTRFRDISVSERILNTVFLLTVGLGYLVALGKSVLHPSGS